MKQSSTTSTRGRKKTANGKSASPRGASATRQNRNAADGSRATGSSSRSNGPSGRDQSDSRSNSAGRGNSPERGNARGRDNAGNRDNSRGRSASSDRTLRDSSDRNTTRGNTSGNSAHHEFTGETHLEKFFLDQLQDIYYAENKITQSLPKMSAATTTGELREAFEDHLHQTQRHVKRLEKVFEVIGQRAEGKRCEAIEGIAREVENIIKETEEGTLTRDAALIIAAQKVEHYEIATYGGLVQLAITMDLHEAADLLDKTLVEEEDTDARLTEIAENEINLRAEHEDTQSSWDAGEAGENEASEEEENENEEAEHPSL